MSVSVVIPTYNRARRLPAAIESALQQGIADLEIIVVDDGSTDDTRAVIAQYGDRVRYHYQPNAGVGAARNTGIREARGEFVAFLDSDDRWLDSKLALQLAVFEACPDVGLVFSDFVIEKPDGTRLEGGADLWAGRRLDFPQMTRGVLSAHDCGHGNLQSEGVQYWHGPMYMQLLHELPILTSSVIVRRAALDDQTWYAERVVLFEDWEFFARVARRWHVGYVATPTTVNVGHLDPGRVSKCSTADRAESYLGLVERVWLPDDDVHSAGAELARAAHSRALLAVARESVLAGRADRARAAVEAWRSQGYTDQAAFAAACAACARMPGGRFLFRNLLRGRTAMRLLTGKGGRAGDSVNPAA